MASTILGGSWIVRVSGSDQTASTDSGIGRKEYSVLAEKVLSAGTGASSYNRCLDTNLPANTTTTYNLTSYTDTSGTAGQSMAKVCVLFCSNDSGSSGNITIGASGANQWNGFLVADANSIIVPPGGTFFWAVPTDNASAVTAVTAQDLTVATAAGTTGKLLILGRSA